MVKTQKTNRKARKTKNTKDEDLCYDEILKVINDTWKAKLQ